MVLACCFSTCSFTLLEPQRRRAGFLELVTSELGLVNVDIVPRRAEELALPSFDVAVARAFAEPRPALTSMVKLVRPGGEALVAVGSSDGLDPELPIVRIDALGNVDSPGLFSMMTRKV
jgi:16S rRNA G527 N7-methylase RsmG